MFHFRFLTHAEKSTRITIQSYIMIIIRNQKVKLLCGQFCNFLIFLNIIPIANLNRLLFVEYKLDTKFYSFCTNHFQHVLLATMAHIHITVMHNVNLVQLELGMIK